MKKDRFWEIDFLRGIAIVMMVLFHLIYSLDYFNITEFNVGTGFWLYFARATASIFILLVGISLTLSFSRYKINPKFSKYVKRGLKIFSWGLIITLVTWIFLRESFVAFGILHLIGVSIILAYPFLRYKKLNLILGSTLLVIGLYLKQFTFSFNWLMWSGFIPQNYQTIDYFPILPWFGLVLIGIFIGKTLYKNHTRQFKFWNLEKVQFVNFFGFLGRHSLFIYLIHQPILLFILYLLGFSL